MKKKSSNKEKVPIRGWLVLIGIAVWLMGIGGAVGLAFEIVKLFVGMPTTETSIETAMSFVGGVLSIVLLVLFGKRKRAFIPVSIVNLAILFIYDIYFDVAIHYPKVSFYADLVYLPIYVISATYLLRSKRVRNTFIG